MAMSKTSACALPLSAAPSRWRTEDPSSSPWPPNPLAAAASFLRHHVSRLSSEISSRVDQGRRLVLAAVTLLAPFCAASQGKHSFDLALNADYVAETLAGTSVCSVSNSNNEFVFISEPSNYRFLEILCFRKDDSQTLLAPVKLRQPILGRGAKIVPIALDQVYMLKAEGIAFRFLPDPLQIKNALTLRYVVISQGFDGVPVFEEDIERELFKAPKASRGSGLYQNIMVESFEDKLKKMERGGDLASIDWVCSTY